MAENKDSKLIAALNARRKLEEANKRLESKKKKEEEAKAVAKKAEEERKKAEKEQKALADEREVLMKLANIKNESKSSRIYFAGQCFFDLLNMFDTGADGKVVKDGKFSKKYNSLNIEDVAKAVLNSCKFNSKAKYGPVIWISRNDLEANLDTLIKVREDAIKAAKEILDAEWSKRLLEEMKKQKEMEEKQKEQREQESPENGNEVIPENADPENENEVIPENAALENENEVIPENADPENGNEVIPENADLENAAPENEGL